MGATVTIPGVRSDPLRGFRFRVKIDGLADDLGFRTVSGLEREVEIAEYREGQDGPAIRKLPGMVVVPNVTLEHGILVDSGASQKAIGEWLDQVNAFDLEAQAMGTAPQAIGLTTDEYARKVEISLIGRQGVIQFQWLLQGCWPTRVTWADLDAQSSDVLIETLELAVGTVGIGGFSPVI